MLINDVLSTQAGAKVCEILTRRFLDRAEWIPGESHDWGLFRGGENNAIRLVFEWIRVGGELKEAHNKMQ